MLYKGSMVVYQLRHNAVHAVVYKDVLESEAATDAKRSFMTMSDNC